MKTKLKELEIRIIQIEADLEHWKKSQLKSQDHHIRLQKIVYSKTNSRILKQCISSSCQIIGTYYINEKICPYCKCNIYPIKLDSQMIDT